MTKTPDANNALFPILGNHLFPPALLKPYENAHFFMAEDLGLCTYVKHHKQKIALFLAAMRSYRDELRDRDLDIEYQELPVTSETQDYESKLAAHLDALRKSGHTIDRLITWEIEDKFFEQRLEKFAEKHNLKWTALPSPMFLTARETFAEYVQQCEDNDAKPFMANFYKQQRQSLDLLMTQDGKPQGGKWSYDADNRKRVPKDTPIPETSWSVPTDHVKDLIPLINDRFADHPGELSEQSWWMPTTRRAALAWLRAFLDDRFQNFGDYEDALTNRDPILWHSALTPTLNLGLITPDEIIERVTEHASENDIPLNSLEGFVRQLIGWREFIRGIYRHYSEEQDTANFFNHKRQLAPAWYDGTTGLVPLDDVIKKANRFGWTHHIERLMVAGNLMLLCEIQPRAAHQWFMEMFVDSADWVMGPNVYGMGIFSDGGVFATKPYICGSNYILKMSDYKKPKNTQENALFADAKDAPDNATWCDVMDGLYWRFIDNHRDYFRSNARLATMVGTLDRIKPERLDHIFAAASTFIDRVTC